jgi:hypothetical protein
MTWTTVFFAIGLPLGLALAIVLDVAGLEHREELLEVLRRRRTR